MKVPGGACEVLRALKAAGYEAFLVGGCVRDALLAEETEAETNDWDICTAARPDEIKEVFAGRRMIDTGLRHGTVTVVMPDGQYEVTTYRIDGTYSDGRHPDSVTFTRSITEDLSRRDFTINAMAMGVDEDGKATEIVDPFGGREDLARRILRCVGDPNVRFEEDALRILRALRFAGRFELQIDPATLAAMRSKRALLQRVSVERIMDELEKILLSERGWEYLAAYREILIEVLPELRACIGCEQRNPWHCSNVFDHIMRSVGNAPKDLTIRMTMLLHDIGKPASVITDADGIDHFYGHPELSAEMAERILRRLHCAGRLTHDVVELVRCHDDEIVPSERALRRLLNKLGTEQARRLLRVKRADTLAQSEMAREKRLSELARDEEILERIIAERQAFARKDLAISGRDILDHGVPLGPEVGMRLQKALDAVIDGTSENEKKALLKIALED